MQDRPVALVTGANKGIGLQIAKDCAPKSASGHALPAGHGRFSHRRSLRRDLLHIRLD
jgi:NAD(P)-dependent dehydrogenase (short-subunit alcohol dehydrogenase family)